MEYELNHNPMTTTQETHPHRALHVRTVSHNSEHNSVIKVQRAILENQYETAKSIHFQHYNTDINQVIDIAIYPVSDTEADQMKASGVPVIYSMKYKSWLEKHSVDN